MKKFKKILKVIVDIVLWLFLIFAVLMTILSLSAQSSDGVPSLGGKTILCVESDSMKPTFEKGDLLIGNKLTDSEKQSCQVGDIITFYYDIDGDGENEVNTHRIVGITNNSDGAVESYTTQGDNKETNYVADQEPTRWQKVLSKWDENGGTKISGVGKVISYLQTPKNFLTVIVVPLILFFLYEIFRFIKTLLVVKGEKAKEITQEEEDAIKQRAIEEYLASQKAEAQAQEAPEEKVNDSELSEDNAPSDKNEADEG